MQNDTLSDLKDELARLEEIRDCATNKKHQIEAVIGIVEIRNVLKEMLFTPPHKSDHRP